jgi:hypothetical protein
VSLRARLADKKVHSHDCIRYSRGAIPIESSHRRLRLILGCPCGPSWRLHSNLIHVPSSRVQEAPDGTCGERGR